MEMGDGARYQLMATNLNVYKLQVTGQNIEAALQPVHAEMGTQCVQKLLRLLKSEDIVPGFLTTPHRL